jgi:hypothetical protein
MSFLVGKVLYLTIPDFHSYISNFSTLFYCSETKIESDPFRENSKSIKQNFAKQPLVSSFLCI